MFDRVDQSQLMPLYHRAHHSTPFGGNVPPAAVGTRTAPAGDRHTMHPVAAVATAGGVAGDRLSSAPSQFYPHAVIPGSGHMMSARQQAMLSYATNSGSNHGVTNGVRMSGGGGRRFQLDGAPAVYPSPVHRRVEAGDGDAEVRQIWSTQQQHQQPQQPGQWVNASMVPEPTGSGS